MSTPTPKPLASFQAVIAGKPIPWQRTSQTKAGKRLTNVRYRSWKTDAAETLAAFARWRTLVGDVSIDIAVHPDGIRVTGVAIDSTDIRRPDGITGDLDNYAKAVLDAMQDAGVLSNDRQIVSMIAHFDPNPRPKATP